MNWRNLKRFLNSAIIRGKNDCWKWQGRLTKHGYGEFTHSNLGWLLAHRIALELKLGRKLIDEECSLHTCDNRACINPHHLFLGTSTDNNKDRHKKGRTRGARGEKNCHSKLTEVEVKRIKRLIAAGKIKRRIIAAQFDVTESTIAQIATGRIWGWV